MESFFSSYIKAHHHYSFFHTKTLYIVHETHLSSKVHYIFASIRKYQQHSCFSPPSFDVLAQIYLVILAMHISLYSLAQKRGYFVLNVRVMYLMSYVMLKPSSSETLHTKRIEEKKDRQPIHPLFRKYSLKIGESTSKVNVIPKERWASCS